MSLLIFLACSKKQGESSKNSRTDSLSIFFNLANDYTLPIEKRLEFTQKTFEVVSNQENDSLNRAYLFKIANRYYNIKNWEGYNKTVQLVLKKAKDRRDTLSILKAYSYLGDYYKEQTITDSAYMYYFKAEKMHLQRKDHVKLAKIRLNKAYLQFIDSDFLGSEISVFKALSAIRGENKKEVLYESYNMLGIVYNELGEYTKAIEFHNKALETIDDKTFPIEFQTRASSLNNLGYVYQNLNKYQQSIPYFEEGLTHKNELLLYKPFVYALLVDNLAYSRFKTKDFRGLPALFYESLKLRDSLNLPFGILYSQIHLSEYYASKGDNKKAFKFSNAALSTARKSKNGRNVLLALKQMSIIDPERAYRYNKEYIHINDSLQKVDRNIADKFTRIEYETDQIKEENSILTSRNRNLIYIFGSFLILGMFLYIVKAQKNKNRELLYKRDQQRVNEEIYNLMLSHQNDIASGIVKEKMRVAQELHDGVLGRMFGVRMNLDSLNKVEDVNTFKQRTGYLEELKKIEQDIREISHDLSREKSELINNFVAIVENLFEEQKTTFEPKLFSSIDSKINWESVSNATKINLYRIIQESLQNINKYAVASIIKVEIKKEDHNLFLQVSDNGIGFNINKAKKGIGLQNMLSRMEECNGLFEINSTIDKGTIIKVTVPV